MDFDNLDLDSNYQDDLFEEELKLMTKENMVDYSSLKDSVVFLVDALSENYHEVFRIAENFLKTKVISNENDSFSLIVYNSDQTNNTSNFNGVSVIIENSIPNEKNIKDLKHAYNSLKELEEQDQIYRCCSKQDNSLYEALYIADTQLKKEKNAAKVIRRIFLFTSRDNPMSINSSGMDSYLEAMSKIIKNEQTFEKVCSEFNASKKSNKLHYDQEVKKTIQKAKDLMDYDITIELFPISLKFDIEKFFAEIIWSSSNEDAQSMKKLFTEGAIKNKLQEISKIIRRKEVKKRTLGKIPFFMTDEVQFDMNIYSCIQEAKKSNSDYFHIETNEKLGKINRMLDVHTSEEVKELGYYQEYGKRPILFTPADMKKIKTTDLPSIKLIGFKSLNLIKQYHNVKCSKFLYPNEFFSAGASRVCDAMINQLIVKNKVAIVKFVAREGSLVRICALLPQKEKFDEDMFQTPPGFHMILLPFSEEIRKNEDLITKLDGLLDKVKQKPKKEGIKMFSDLIKKLNFSFNSKDFENYYLQKFYSVIQSSALGEEDADDDIIDHMKIPDTAFEKIGPYEARINEEFGNLIVIDKKKKKKEEDGDNEDAKSTTSSKRKTKSSVEKKKNDKKDGKKDKEKDVELVNKMIQEEEYMGSTIGSSDDILNETLEKKVKAERKSKSKSKSKSVSIKDEKLSPNKLKYVIPFNMHSNFYDDEKLIKLIDTDRIDNLKTDLIKKILKDRKITFNAKNQKKDLILKLRRYLEEVKEES